MNRIKSLDILRGLTVALMIVVNNPGTWQYVFPCLRHAAWDGCTLTDLVFPSFLFIVGASVFFAFRRYDHRLSAAAVRKIVVRGVLIYLVGLLLMTFPYYDFGRGAWLDLSRLRLLGVLPRIALVYTIGTLMALPLRDTKKIALAAAGILVGYVAIVYGFGDGTLEGYVGRRIDLAILGEGHMYRYGQVPFDPEGLLSTLPAIGTFLIGYLAAQWFTRAENILQGLRNLLAAGGILLLAGLAFSYWVPLNKPIWSSSYVLYTAGISMICWGILAWVCDWRKKGFADSLFEVFGTNALFAYVLSGLIGKVSRLPFLLIGEGDDRTNFFGWVYRSLAGVMPAEMASLAVALLLAAISWGIVYPLYRKRIFIKL